MDRREPTLKETQARREREVRIVQAVIGGIVGALSGAFGSGYIIASGTVMAVAGLVGLVGGAIGGYYAPAWLTSVER